MNLGALFPNLGEPAAPAAAYPSAAGGLGTGGWWIWILIILAFLFLFRGPGFGGLGFGRPGCGTPPGCFGGGGLFG